MPFLVVSALVLVFKATKALIQLTKHAIPCTGERARGKLAPLKR